MSISVKSLEELVLSNARTSDSVTIISGYFSADIIDHIASTGIPVTFYYGMYLWNGMTDLQYRSLNNLLASHKNLNINVVTGYHVHTKCYIFSRNTGSSALIGSANCSDDGLCSSVNCEMLTETSDASDMDFLWEYAEEIKSVSVPLSAPSVVPYSRSSGIMKKASASKKRVYSGNPFVDNIPLYNFRKGKKFVETRSGINWGLQKGNTVAHAAFAEAYIPIKKFDLKYHQVMIPICGAPGSGTGGKKTRMQSPVTVTWDDGTVMRMLFQGTQEYPAKVKAGTPQMVYPKQLSTDDGGIVLGEYLRRRMNVPGHKVITMADLTDYGRDYITLTYLSPGIYEADFSK